MSTKSPSSEIAYGTTRPIFKRDSIGFDTQAHLRIADPQGQQLLNREATMLHYAVVFLIIALIAGAFGFFGVAGTAVGIAKILFAVFLVLFVVSLLMGRRSRL